MAFAESRRDGNVSRSKRRSLGVKKMIRSRHTNVIECTNDSAPTIIFDFHDIERR